MRDYFDVEIKYFVLKKCNSSWSLKKGEINFYDLTFVINGEATYYIDNKPYKLRKGEGIFIPIGSVREAETTSENPLECVACSLYGEDIEEIPIEKKFCWGENDKLKIYFKEFNIEWLEKNSMYRLKCKALLNLIFYELIQLNQISKRNIHVESMKRYIIENIHTKLTVNEIAEELRIHPVYCGALFKEHMQMSIHQYINQMRISKAKELIALENMPIHMIGFAVGIEDAYYFSKLFKQIVGVSPTIYRQSIIG